MMSLDELSYYVDDFLSALNNWVGALFESTDTLVVLHIKITSKFESVEMPQIRRTTQSVTLTVVHLKSDA